MVAFIARSPLPTFTRSTTSVSRVICSAQNPNPNVSRRTLLTSAAATLLAAFSVSPARADNPNGLERAFSSVFFPKEGFNAPDNNPPSPTSVVKKELLETDAGKKALQTIRDYEKSIKDVYEKFKNDPQFDLTEQVKSLVDVSELRNALNTVNEAISDESQQLSDKVVRGIIQDFNELQNSSVLKEGVERTKKKIERTGDWFEKLSDDFGKLLQFYS